MAERIPDRLWLAQAQGLLPGADDKIMHKGCGDRPSLFIKNDDDKYWAYCHRCRGTGFKDKELPRIKMALSTKTGWMPSEFVPIVQAVVEQPYNFRELFSRFGLAPYVTLLRFSPDTKRVYFPDESNSYLGLDATFKANARFYSPHKRNLCVSIKGTGDCLVITSNLQVYLSAVAGNSSAILTMNATAERSAIAVVSTYAGQFAHVELDRLSDRFKRELRAFL